MPHQDRKALIDEAADIFVRLRETPDNAEIQAERDAFLKRGKDEREVYAHVTKAWVGAGRKAGPNKLLMIALLAGLISSTYFWAENARNYLFSDFTTRLEAREIILSSGDRANLDADTAVAEDSDASQRNITLFEGAALFEVTNDGRPFEVSAGDLSIAVVGTVFEAARIDDIVTVSVSEGEVSVTSNAAQWTLKAGERLLWSEHNGGDVVDIEAANVALWRQGRFVSDGLTLKQVADVIGRRLPGSVVIQNSTLANSRVSGTINLENPRLALEALAATRGARVISVQPFGYLVLP